MIIVSVAHSVGTGAYNKEIKVDEYECSQIMSQACANLLAEKGIQTFLIDAKRSTFPEYKHIKKAYISKQKPQPQLALEIHLNSCDDESINYSSCFFNLTNLKTKALSDRIVSGFQLKLFNKISHGFKSVGLPEKGYDSKRFWFINDLPCDSIVIEPCFLSNNFQATKCKDPMFLQNIGESVAEAIIECQPILKL